jgi:hypothetical protein
MGVGHGDDGAGFPAEGSLDCSSRYEGGGRLSDRLDRRAARPGHAVHASRPRARDVFPLCPDQRPGRCRHHRSEPVLHPDHLDLLRPRLRSPHGPFGVSLRAETHQGRGQLVPVQPRALLDAAGSDADLVCLADPGYRVPAEHAVAPGDLGYRPQHGGALRADPPSSRCAAGAGARHRGPAQPARSGLRRPRLPILLSLGAAPSTRADRDRRRRGGQDQLSGPAVDRPDGARLLRRPLVRRLDDA